MTTSNPVESTSLKSKGFGFYGVALLCALLLVNSSAEGWVRDERAYQELDAIALRVNTDKSSAFHNYTKIYADHFAQLRNEPLKFLEIGIYRGHSVQLWEGYFPHAELHFIDITSNLIEYYSTRSHYHFLDQSNVKALHQLAGSLGGNFDIIIDDGGHRMDQQIISFQTLFPYLAPGGIYIIEDLHTSYWKEYGGHGSIGQPLPGPGTCVEFLKKLIDELNYTAGVTTCADSAKAPDQLSRSLNLYQAEIEALYFYQSLCFIIKK